MTVRGFWRQLPNTAPLVRAGHSQAKHCKEDCQEKLALSSPVPHLPPETQGVRGHTFHGPMGTGRGFV